MNRMNPSRVFLQYINGLSDQVTRHIRSLLDDNKRKEAWEYLFEYYEDVTPISTNTMKSYLDSIEDENEREVIIDEHLKEVYNNGIYLIMPPNTPDIGSKLIKRLNDKYKLDIGPVTFRGVNGEMVTTKLPMLIARLHFIRLDKTANDWSATTFPKRQHHGIPAKLSNSDKYSENYRNQATRILGEAEFRILISKTSPAFASMMLVYPNSPEMCMAATRSILTAENPSNIDRLMDYQSMIKKGSRSLQFVKHILKCAGVEFVYADDRKYGNCEIYNFQVCKVTEDGEMVPVEVEYDED